MKLKDNLSLDDLIDVQGGGDLDSPLTLMSPNVLQAAEDGLGNLPNFNKPRNRTKDPRRQSTAIFSAFTQATESTGLLTENEICVGDEDIIIPLAKSGNLLGTGAAAKNVDLWVDPDTDELLDADLPQPSLESNTTDSPQQCASPVQKPSTTTSSVMAVAQSAAISAGFEQLCNGQPGLEDILEEDLPSLSCSTQQPGKSLPPAVVVIKKEPKKVEPRRPSRLKAPSSSSSYFTKTITTTATSPIKAPTAAVVPKKEKKAPERIHPVLSRPTRAPVVAQPAMPPSPNTVPVPTMKLVAAAPKAAPAITTKPPAASTRKPSSLPAPPAARKPTALPSAPSAAVQSSSGTSSIKKQPVSKPATTAAKPAQPKTVKAPATASKPRVVAPPPVYDDNEPLSPQSAHLRWLEQNPDLAFGGGGAKLMADSPKQDPNAKQKKKTALEQHYQAWEDDLVPLR